MERECMEFDVLVVGGGPAGLSAACRIKQLAIENNKELSVCVVEKGSEVGAHILSGAILQPTALDELVEGWRSDENCPVKTLVKSEELKYLSESKLQHSTWTVSCMCEQADCMELPTYHPTRKWKYRSSHLHFGYISRAGRLCWPTNCLIVASTIAPMVMRSNSQESKPRSVPTEVARPSMMNSHAASSTCRSPNRRQ